mmetsp:Transcript_40/g.70  ORF Transcript_40/g.70 Transcript_40/m.70 type:complete len:143 (-) Transcript_40:221-649(-)|eukprot:CAMPEP_0119308822 /NCGR_PEP_ID=MMETSP1333-20130426/12788_1 /TAXON_ID=418940 /ORGANISM="Scyphosphaera apsteinii, Strain RCC1455" /LENGTH=142 /DNA_ID=CAMNT_0007312681 /DNA_START=57 /DNA_END=485 /DNA_ORIENTATION=+
MRERKSCRLMLLLLLLAGLSLTSAIRQEGKKTNSHSKAKSPTPGPFSAFVKQLPQEKKATFQELLKKMRLTKHMPKSQKKASMQQLDAEIHKLLGDGYKTYRSIAEKARGEVKDGVGGVGDPAAEAIKDARGLIQNSRKRLG